MQEIQVRTDDLWYTDNPFRSEERLKVIREKRGTEKLPSILICACKLEYQGEVRNYVIVDGNRRAFVDNEQRGISQARLIENDQDLEAIMDELVDDHGLKKSGVRQLSVVIQGYQEWIPRAYEKGKLVYY